MKLEWWMLGLLLAAVMAAVAAWRARRQPLALQVLPDATAEVQGVPVVLEGSDLVVEVSLVGRAEVQATVGTEDLDDSWWTAVSESAVLRVWHLALPTTAPGQHTVTVRAGSGGRRVQTAFDYRVVPLAVRGGTVEFSGPRPGGVHLTFWGVIDAADHYQLDLEFQPLAGRTVHLTHKASLSAGEHEYRFTVERQALDAQGGQGPYRLVGATLQPVDGALLPTPLDLEPWPEDAAL
ncbi:hypothetical protein [Deinococcus ficus]|uniref:Uncharacterized protein n=1 Tax=Deinococcus ficus TaxID=317577 RepID=A0A221T3F6_9DEIO|nr:hypothetical protein [Deinococcus ficus]ASN83447.1 hypothetical protein DFI_19815 [Deinococcus ficus]